MSLPIGKNVVLSHKQVKAHHSELMGDQSMPGQRDESAIHNAKRYPGHNHPGVTKSNVPNANHAGRKPVDAGSHLKWHSGR